MLRSKVCAARRRNTSRSLASGCRIRMPASAIALALCMSLANSANLSAGDRRDQMLNCCRSASRLVSSDWGRSGIGADATAGSRVLQGAAARGGCASPRIEELADQLCGQLRHLTAAAIHNRHLDAVDRRVAGGDRNRAGRRASAMLADLLRAAHAP